MVRAHDSRTIQDTILRLICCLNCENVSNCLDRQSTSGDASILNRLVVSYYWPVWTSKFHDGITKDLPEFSLESPMWHLKNIIRHCMERTQKASSNIAMVPIGSVEYVLLECILGVFSPCQTRCWTRIRPEPNKIQDSATSMTQGWRTSSGVVKSLRLSAVTSMSIFGQRRVAMKGFFWPMGML